MAAAGCDCDTEVGVGGASRRDECVLARRGSSDLFEAFGRAVGDLDGHFVAVFVVAGVAEDDGSEEGWCG